MTRIMMLSLLILGSFPFGPENTGPKEAGAQEVPVLRSTAADREAVTLTVYNQNFGLVREIRSIELGRGLLGLEFGDVASTIQP